MLNALISCRSSFQESISFLLEPLKDASDTLSTGPLILFQGMFFCLRTHTFLYCNTSSQTLFTRSTEITPVPSPLQACNAYHFSKKDMSSNIASSVSPLWRVKIVVYLHRLLSRLLTVCTTSTLFFFDITCCPYSVCSYRQISARKVLELCKNLIILRHFTWIHAVGCGAMFILPAKCQDCSQSNRAMPLWSTSLYR